jgi:hypothetical protein
MACAWQRGLAALPGAGDPGPGSQLGRHVQHPLPVDQQPLRDRAADPVRAFCRADPFRPLPRELQQLAVAACISGESVARKISRLSRASIVTDSSCGTAPMITLSIAMPPRPGRITCQARTGNATSS